MVHWGLTLKPHTNPQGYSKQKDVNMEDFFNNLKNNISEKIKFSTRSISLALKDIGNILEDTKRNDYKFLCAIRALVKDSSHGRLILEDNEINYLKYSWVSDDYTVITILDHYFGFSEKYIERVVRCINKFLVVKAQDDVVLGTQIGYINYIFDFLYDLTISKIIELLPLSNDQIKKAFDTGSLSIQSTCKQIREYVKAIKGGANTENKVLEDTSNDDYEAKAEEITDCGLYLKLNKESFDYVKNVVDKHKSKYKDANVFLNALIKYAIDNKLFL